MGVYTNFGGMRGLVHEIVYEGFARLQKHMSDVAKSDDPVADMALLGHAYKYNALSNPHLFTVMFGGASLGGFSLSEKDRQHGRYTLSNVVECASRCLAAGRFSPADAGLIAHQMWIATHGLVTLELGDYLVDPWDAERCFEIQLVWLMTGAGDNTEDAARSVAHARTRFEADFLGRPERAGPPTAPEVGSPAGLCSTGASTAQAAMPADGMFPCNGANPS